jgi:hypothetical protein
VPPAEAWEEHWEKTYALAAVSIEGIVARWVGPAAAFSTTATSKL